MHWLRTMCIVGLPILTVAACGGASSSDDDRECIAAGGTCITGPGGQCATLGPNGGAGCIDPGPAGGVCCLATYDEQTCAERTSEAQAATLTAETQAESDLTCVTDADCVVASNASECWISCGVVLNEAGAAQLAMAIAEINSTTCATFDADRCVATAPPCAPLTAYCAYGACSDVPPASTCGPADPQSCSDAGK